jgi:hypothetical protein
MGGAAIQTTRIAPHPVRCPGRGDGVARSERYSGVLLPGGEGQDEG